MNTNLQVGKFRIPRVWDFKPPTAFGYRLLAHETGESNVHCLVDANCGWPQAARGIDEVEDFEIIPSAVSGSRSGSALFPPHLRKIFVGEI